LSIIDLRIMCLARVENMQSEAEIKTDRQLACPRCGMVFSCSLSGECWCEAETFRLPMPPPGGEDCLCPACLRAAALAAHPKDNC
jgi:hypothetical protein